jgi:nucleoside-diphosphate-sugar epimerase
MTPITQKIYVAGHVGMLGSYLVRQLTNAQSNAAPLIASESRRIFIPSPSCCDSCEGDERNSLTNISKAQRLLAYTPTHPIRQGNELAMPWYVR